jgi:molybdopterin-guanine dinucleotide biosynthesis protein A
MSGHVPAVILAGGRSQRMGGGDKCLLPLGDTTILAHVVAALRPQTSAILLNSNSDPQLFAATGLEVRADALPGRLGPLAGIHTAMLWAQEIGAPSVLTVPADTPFLPHDLVARLVMAGAGGHIAIAAHGSDLHPTVGLWPSNLAAVLRRDLEGGVRRVRAWLDLMSFKAALFEPAEPDPFWNVNTPDEWAKTSSLLRVVVPKPRQETH